MGGKCQVCYFQRGEANQDVVIIQPLLSFTLLVAA